MLVFIFNSFPVTSLDYFLHGVFFYLLFCTPVLVIFVLIFQSTVVQPICLQFMTVIRPYSYTIIVTANSLCTVKTAVRMLEREIRCTTFSGGSPLWEPKPLKLAVKLCTPKYSSIEPSLQETFIHLKVNCLFHMFEHSNSIINREPRQFLVRFGRGISSTPCFSSDTRRTVVSIFLSDRMEF